MDEDEKQHVLDLEADLVDLNDSLDSVNKILAGTKLAAEERADKEKLKANFERRIAAKKVQIAKMNAIIKRRSLSEEDADADASTLGANSYTLHPSRIILKARTLAEFLKDHSHYGEDEASPPWKTAEELLALTYKYFKINDPELEALTLKQIFEQNLQDKVLIAHPMRIIHRIKNLNAQDPDEAARARLLIFGDRDFKTPVIEAASSNASAGDMALTHLNNDL